MTSSTQCFCQERCCQSVYCSFMSSHTCFHKASTWRRLWGCPGIKPGSTDSLTSSGAALSFHKGADSSLSQSSSEEGKKQSINKNSSSILSHSSTRAKQAPVYPEASHFNFLVISRYPQAFLSHLLLLLTWFWGGKEPAPWATLPFLQDPAAPDFLYFVLKYYKWTEFVSILTSWEQSLHFTDVVW